MWWKNINEIFKQLKSDQRGNLLLFSIVFGSISLILIIGGVSGYALSENKASLHKHNREMAFQIAEAGANYYRWHLAHDKNDYYDGQGATSTGPYIHSYNDKDGNVIGYYSLEIAEPLLGSTVVTVTSTGWTTIQPGSKRIVKIRVGFPSLTDYAFLTNSDVWIGDTESTNGKFHSNGGIHYDGVGNAPITSAMQTYLCQWHHGCSYPNGDTKNGVWGNGGPQSYWEYPVPAQDFNAVTVKLAEIKTGAESGGLKLTSSNKKGWHLNFQADGTVRARKVNSVYWYWGLDVGGSSYYRRYIDIASYSGGWTTYSMPSNGYIYVEDDVWVDGTVNGRATVGAKKDSTTKSIIINGNILYKEKDGNHVLGLIASKDILIPRNSPSNLEIDAAMLAQTGAAKRYLFYPYETKQSIITYGAVITNGIWTWSWVNQYGQTVSGYESTSAIYDVNLTYGPPPAFPVGTEYNLISWEEVE